MVDKTTTTGSDAVDLDKLEALAKAAEQMFTGMHWYTRFQILDGISNDESAALISALDPDTVLTLIAQARAAAPAATDWAEAQRICNLPAVDEAIRGLLEDSTGDNATCLVREVMRALSQQPVQAAGDEKILPEGFTLAPVQMPEKMRVYLQDRLHHPICKAEVVWKMLLKMGLGMEDE